MRAHGCKYRASLSPERASARLARAAEWIAAHPEEEKAYQARYREGNRVALHAKKRARKYGLSHEEQAALLASQCGGCAICATPIGLEVGGGAHLDHDHDTGMARGFLCRNCNTILGMAKDSPSRLRAAAVYLDRRQPKLRLVR